MKLFNTKIQHAVSKDELRPAMCHVYFKNGYAFASNGHILIQERQTFLTEQEVKLLDGKMIHGSSISMIHRSRKFEILDIGIKITYKSGQTVIIPFEDGEKYPDVIGVLSSVSTYGLRAAEKMNLGSSELSKICAVFSGLYLTFYHGKDETSAITVKTSDENIMGIIMPATVGG